MFRSFHKRENQIHNTTNFLFAKKKDDDALDEILSFEQTNQGDALSIAVLILLCGCFFLWYDNVGIYMT